MTENRRYYYLKLKEYFFNSETMMIRKRSMISHLCSREKKWENTPKA